MAFDPNTAKPISSGFDPSTAKAFEPEPAQGMPLEAPQEPQEQPTSIGATLKQYIPDDPANAIISGVSGLRKGTVDAVGQTGDLGLNLLEMLAQHSGHSTIAKTIKSFHDKASDVGSKVKEYLDSSPVDIQASNQYPVTNAIGAGTGNVLTGMAASNAIAAPVTGLLSKVAPLAKYPTFAAQAFRSGETNAIVGGIYGAAQNPEDPVKGLLAGGVIGGTTGVLGGYLGARAQRGSAIVKDVFEDAKSAGLSPKNMQIMDNARHELNSGGKGLKQEEILSQLKDNVSNKLNIQSPKAVRAKIDAAYQPLNEAEGLIVPTNSQAALAPLQARKLALPEEALPENATIKEMMDYKKALKGYKNAAMKQVHAGTLVKEKADLYGQLDKALEADIKTSSYNQGLGDQFEKAQKINYDESIQGKLVNLYKMSLTAKEGNLNPMVFDRRANKLMNDPMVQRNKEMMETIKGVKQIVSYGRNFSTGSGAVEKAPGVIEKVYQSIIHSDAGIQAIRALGSMSPTSKVFRDIMQKLFTGGFINKISPDIEDSNSNQDPTQVLSQLTKDSDGVYNNRPAPGIPVQRLALGDESPSMPVPPLVHPHKQPGPNAKINKA